MIRMLKHLKAGENLPRSATSISIQRGECDCRQLWRTEDVCDPNAGRARFADWGENRSRLVPSAAGRHRSDGLSQAS